MGVYGLTSKKVLTHPLKFIDIYYDISAGLPQQPGLKLVEIELNKVIRMINDTLGLWRELTGISTGSITTNIDEVATWDNNIDEWVALDSSYRNPTRKGLRIANKLATVDMLELPIQNPEAVQ